MRWLGFLVAFVGVGIASSAWPRDLPGFVEEMLKGDGAIVVTGSSSDKSPVVTLGRRFGGSVVSLYYRGVEYVNNHDSRNRVDYGRQLQSAVQYRGVGECFNPTQAGGRYDRGRPSSSSRLISLERPSRSVVTTQTDMAFWMAPRQKKAWKNKECTALNNKYRAGYLLKRRIQVGVEGSPNVISYQTQFVAPVVEASPRYEAVVIHTSARFSRVFRVDEDGHADEVLGKNAERGKLPYMQATNDAQHAVVVCWAFPMGKTYYGFRRADNTVASRYVYYGEKPEKESPVFENFVIVGTAAEVRKDARRFCFHKQSKKSLAPGATRVGMTDLAHPNPG